MAQPIQYCKVKNNNKNKINKEKAFLYCYQNNISFFFDLWLCKLVYVLLFDFHDYDFITFKFFEVNDASFIIFVALNSAQCFTYRNVSYFSF